MRSTHSWTGQFMEKISDDAYGPGSLVTCRSQAVKTDVKRNKECTYRWNGWAHVLETQ
jgi:hypothetical protein